MDDNLKQKPKVSVIMAAYNEEKSIGRAIQSVLAQTFADWELIIVNDGSTDDTLSEIKKIKDGRVKTITHKKNTSFAQSLNDGILSAKSQYIAIWDADDTCDKTRFEKQVKFMDENPDISACSAWGKMVSENGMVELREPISPEEIKKCLIKFQPIIHSCMLYRASMIKNNPYDTALKRSEDYDLFLRLVKKYKFANIPEFLITFETSDSKKYHIRDKLWSFRVKWRAFTKYGYSWTHIHWLFIPFINIIIPKKLKLFLRKVIGKTG
jgi:glycosyltransferase involved in cell wall biosynthesis